MIRENKTQHNNSLPKNGLHPDTDTEQVIKRLEKAGTFAAADMLRQWAQTLAGQAEKLSSDPLKETSISERIANDDKLRTFVGVFERALRQACTATVRTNPPGGIQGKAYPQYLIDEFNRIDDGDTYMNLYYHTTEDDEALLQFVNFLLNQSDREEPPAVSEVQRELNRTLDQDDPAIYESFKEWVAHTSAPHGLMERLQGQDEPGAGARARLDALSGRLFDALDRHYTEEAVAFALSSHLQQNPST